MKKINLLDSQVLTCKDLIESHLTTVKISLFNAEKWIEEAEQYQQFTVIEKQQKAMKVWEKEKKELEALLLKFN